MGWEIGQKREQPVEIEEDSSEEDSRTNKNGGGVEKPSIQMKKANLDLPVWNEKMAGETSVSKFQITVDDKLTLPMKFVDDKLVSLLKERLIFQNPGYFNRARFGKTKRGEEPWVYCIWQSEDGRHLVMPRGFTHDLVQILHGHRLKPELIDRTLKPQPVEFLFMGGLYGRQQKALQELRPYRFGILKSGLGTGKKVVCLKVACERRCPVLVIVKTKKQMYQWVSLVRGFIMGADDHFGLIGDGHQDLDRDFIIAIDRSLYRCLPHIMSRVGFLVVDQCHLTNLKIFYKIVLLMNCPYMLGLSSVSKRGDGLDRLMRAFVGPIRCEMKPPEGRDSIPKPMLTVNRTAFEFEYKENFGQMIGSLIQDEARNDLIITDILEQSSSPTARGLVISQRLNHLEILQGLLDGNYKKSMIINSRVPEKQRIQIFNEFDRGALQIILITLKSLSDVEVKFVNRIFVSTPLKIGEHMAQVIARLLAPQGGEPGKVFDYLDRDIGVLKASFARRLKFYRLMNFQIEKFQKH